MPSRRPLTAGKNVSASDYESIARAVFGAYGTNGVDLRLVNGRLQASGRAGYGSVDHPFKFRDVSTEEDPHKFTVSSGQFLARGRTGENSEFPEVGDGEHLFDDPPPTFTVGDGKDGYVVLKAEYTMTGGKAVWSASSIYVLEVDEDAALTLPNDYLAGYLALMRVRRSSGNGLVLMNTYVRSNIAHTKCNTHHHFWSFA